MGLFRIAMAVLLAAMIVAPAARADDAQAKKKAAAAAAAAAKKNAAKKAQPKNVQKPKAKPAAVKKNPGNTVPPAATGERLEPILTAPPSSATAATASDSYKIQQARALTAAAQEEAAALALVKEKLVLSRWTPDRVVDAEGNTLLHQAAGNGYLSVVQLLLSEGADPAIRNKLQQTPADVARAHNRADIEEALNAAAAKRRASGS